MHSALLVDLKPGESLGPFEIGASLWAVLDFLRHNTTLFPRVDVKYDPDAAASTPVILHIHPHLDLLFTGFQQRLRTIALRRLRDLNPPAVLRYNGVVLSSESTLLRRSDVSRHFGPTFPGDGLHYPGVSFLFEDDGPVADTAKNASTSPGRDDRFREVRRVIVSQTHPDSPERDVLDDVEECSTMTGSIRKVQVKIHDGIKIFLFPTESQPIHVQIGVTTAQDLTCELGAPLRVYYKEDDRMTIHARMKSPEVEDGCAEFAHTLLFSELKDQKDFYNYFQLGIDFLLSGSTHVVQKIILHTNLPGTPMFQRYQRCPWELEGAPEDDEDDNPPTISFHEKFESISRFLSKSSRDSVPSMVFDRGAEDDRLTLPNSTMHLVGFDGVVLEVTETSQVATVVLF